KMDPFSYYMDYEYLAPGIITGIIGWLAGIFIFGMAVTALTVVAKWFLYEKAGRAGWSAVIPFYTDYILYEITWGEGFLFFLHFIPIAGLVFDILTRVKLAGAFGKSGGWAVGLVFLNPIFISIMAFDKTVLYKGVPDGRGGWAPNEASGANQSYQNPYQNGYQPPYEGANSNAEQDCRQESPQNGAYYYGQPAPRETHCPACGELLENNEKFCPKCGQKQ
ncbi:MAG: DUF5684 domain-containing protein, partial [Oscillospiraceae bacterium]